MLHPKPENLKELFSYRLNRLAHLSSALAARMNESYNLQPRDWRIVGMLAAFAPMSLNTLAREVNIDKSKASRAVADLIGRGLIVRGADALDGRGVQLSLTPEGRALYRKMFPKALARNEELLAVLSDADREAVERAVSLMTEHALSLLNATRNGRTAAKTRAGKTAPQALLNK